MEHEGHDLVDRLLAGDEAAFETLVRRYHDRLLRLARTYVRTDAQAADVVQDTWLAVLRGLPGFERRSSIQTWIFRILMNRARTHAVREGRLVAFGEADQGNDPVDAAADREWFDASGHWRTPPAPWPSLDPERLLLDDEIRRRLDAAIEALPPGQRAVVVLRDVEGLPAGEVCNLLGITETNQRVLLHRGRTRIRAALADLLGRDTP
jgi:RNA polymerase sigma-70 factor (ECF subfamily)